MKKLLLALLFALPINATLTLIQHPTVNCGAVSTCNLTVTSTGSGHAIIVIGGYGNGSSIAVSSVSGGGTYTACAVCTGFAFASRGVFASYTLNSSSGATTITVTMASAPGSLAFEAREYSATGDFMFDTGNTAQITSSTSTPAGIALTLMGTNDVIVQSVVTTGAPVANAITSPYNGNPDFNLNSFSFADALNQANGAAPTWTLSAASAQIFESAIALSESTPGTKRKKYRLLDF